MTGKQSQGNFAASEDAQELAQYYATALQPVAELPLCFTQSVVPMPPSRFRKSLPGDAATTPSGLPRPNRLAYPINLSVRTHPHTAGAGRPEHHIVGRTPNDQSAITRRADVVAKRECDGLPTAPCPLPLHDRRLRHEEVGSGPVVLKTASFRPARIGQGHCNEPEAGAPRARLSRLFAAASAPWPSPWIVTVAAPEP